LNRVIGLDPSIINGLLSANGRIFLINPNGLLIGPTGRVNVNSFLASTLDINNEDFLADRFVFSQSIGQSLASIINQGTITAAEGGSVSLFAPAVRNEGTIVANLGVVMAQAGNRVVLVDADLRRSALHKCFEVPNREGLTNALVGDEAQLDGWLRETEIENLRVLTSGPPICPDEARPGGRSTGCTADVPGGSCALTIRTRAGSRIRVRIRRPTSSSRPHPSARSERRSTGRVSSFATSAGIRRTRASRPGLSADRQHLDSRIRRVQDATVRRYQIADAVAVVVEEMQRLLKLYRRRGACRDSRLGDIQTRSVAVQIDSGECPRAVIVGHLEHMPFYAVEV